MSKLKSFLRKYWFYVVAFILPWLVVIINSFIADSWVTGNGSILTGDTTQQLVPFAYELWEKIHTGDSLAYTWNLAGGCDFQAVSGYFISPFTILLLIFPKTWIPNMMQFIMVLKWAFAAVTMVYFFYHTRHNTLNEHKEAVSLFLGMAFVFSNSQINFVRYIQFGDVTICFPILLLLIEKMVEKKKWILYCIVLTFVMLSNTYMAYGICLFLVIWFIMQLGSGVTEKWKKFFIFAGSSVLSAAISLSVILSGLAISANRLSVTGTSERLNYAKLMLISPSDFIKQLFILAPIEDPIYTTPNIYFSIIAVMLVLCFPFIKIGKKRKAFMSGMVIIMIASFFDGALSLVWHLFNPPNGVYHRFSNIFVFMMLFVVLYVLIHFQELRMKHTIFIGILTVTVCVITFLSLDEYNTFGMYLITALLIALYIMLLVLYCRKSITYKNMLLVVVVFGMLELTANAYCQFISYNTAAYSKKDVDIPITADLLEEAELDFGERVTSSAAMPNVSLLASKASASGFASSINGYNQLFYDRLGMGINGKVSYTARGASPLINLLLNIRYVIGEDTMESSDAEVVAEKEAYQLYRTKRLAGLGYMVDSAITEWDVYSVNCFDTQNSFVQLAVGGDDIFTGVSPEITCYDIEGNEIVRSSDYIKYNSYVYDFTSKYGNQYDSIQAEITVDEDMDLYAFSYSTFYGTISVFIDGELQHADNNGFTQSTYHIGEVKKGQKITMVVVCGDFDKNMDMTWFLRFAKFNEEAYTQAYEKLSKNVYDIETMESDYVKGSITAEEDGIMMTSIQANVGFDVYVDGEKTQCETIGGAMIGVPLEKGKHTVEFKYVGVSPWYGKVISCCAIGLFIVLCLVEAGKRRKLVMEGQN